MTPKVTTYAISLATFRRPVGIARLLGQILNERDDNKSWKLVVVIVVDNDPHGSGRDSVAKWAHAYTAAGISLVYEVEPTPGISAARNKGLSLLPESVEFVAICDDDEVIVANWPRGLQEAIDRLGADAVGGPVTAVCEPDTPPWMLRPHFLSRKPRVDGSHQSVLATNNILFRRSSLPNRSEVFDHRLGLLGGSDHKLTREMSAEGLFLSWASSAQLGEIFGPDRANITWLRTRWRRYGVNGAMIEIGQRGRRTRVRLGGEGLTRCMLGLLGAPLLVLPWSRAHIIGAECLRNVFYGAGLFEGSLGRTVVSYGTSGAETTTELD